MRIKERAALIAALSEAGLLQGEARSDEAELPTDVLLAVHRFIARTLSLLATVRLADMEGPVAPTNLPGTLDAYPNWRFRSPVPLEDLPVHPAFLNVTGAMAEERLQWSQDHEGGPCSSRNSGRDFEG